MDVSIALMSMVGFCYLLFFAECMKQPTVALLCSIKSPADRTPFS